MGNKLSHTDLRDGPDAVAARLRAGANPNQRFRFSEWLGPLPANCPCTPLGYAILASDLPLLDTLLSAGANPRKPVGLPQRCDLPPLHLAAVVGNGEAAKRLLAAGADPGARLGSLAASVGFFRWLLGEPIDAPLPPVLQMVETYLWAGGDTPLHLAADVGAGDVISALLSAPSSSSTNFDVNALNEYNESPLYRACSASQSVRQTGCARLLIRDPRVDVDAGGALFGAIQTQDASLVHALLDAGARVDRGMLNVAGQSPLAFCLYRDSVFFGNRAGLLWMLMAAGADIEPGMIEYARQRKWPRVLAALEVGCRYARQRRRREGQRHQRQEKEGVSAVVVAGREGSALGGERGRMRGRGISRPARPALRLRTGPDTALVDSVMAVLFFPILIPIAVVLLAVIVSVLVVSSESDLSPLLLMPWLMSLW